MHIKEDSKSVERLLNRFSKEELVRMLLENSNGTAGSSIPISVFSTQLSPLEAVSRFLREQGMGVNEIARTLHRLPPAVSVAYRNACTKQFDPEDTDVMIPFSAFREDLSILESVVTYLRLQGRKDSEIAILLGRSPKTVWTCHNRASEKLVGRLQGS